MNQKILLVLILSSIFLVSCSIIELPKDVTGNVVSVVSCSDSDNGRNADVLGTITVTYSDGSVKRLSDVCALGKLREYYCSGRLGYSTSISCAQSCTNGVCVGGVAAVQHVCTDTDGGRNYEVGGQMRVDGGAINKDACTLTDKANSYLDNPVQSCDGDGIRCKLQEKSCAADGTGVHGKYVVPVGKKCETGFSGLGAVIDDPCPPVTTRSCSNGDIYENVTKCGVSTSTLVTDCQEGCVMQNNVPICTENCAEEKTYECVNRQIFEVTRRCGNETSRRQLAWRLETQKCENDQLSELICPAANGLASWNINQWQTSSVCSIFGCNRDGTRCCTQWEDNLPIVQPSYCDRNTYVNATYTRCDGGETIPSRIDCSSIEIWTANGGRQNVPGQCQTVNGIMGCYACGYDYCFEYGGSHMINFGSNCWTPDAVKVNVACP